MSASYSNYGHYDDNMSIQLDQETQSKPVSQLTQEIQEMARKMAESDRNNEAYREVKKTKSFELANIYKVKRQLEEENAQIEENISTKQKRLYENKFAKKQKNRFEEIQLQLEEEENKEKQLQKRNSEINKENEKLEKVLTGLQMKHESMVKDNRHKRALLDKLKAKKMEKMNRIEQNRQKMTELQFKCEETKECAEEIERQLRRQISVCNQLEEQVKLKEHSLQIQRKQREEASRKQEQNRRQVNKLLSSAQETQAQIDEKINEFENLEVNVREIQILLRRQLQQHKKLEEKMFQKAEKLKKIQMDLVKANKQAQSFQKMKRINDEQ